MNKKVSVIIVLILIFLGLGGYFVWTKRPNNTNNLISNTENLPATCKDEQEGIPVITSLSNYSSSVGTILEINGCNFTGFEGDKNAWIENSQGVKGILYGARDTNSKTIQVTLTPSLCQQDNSYSGLPCGATLPLIPGVYKIYASAWGKQSNKVNFTIK